MKPRLGLRIKPCGHIGDEKQDGLNSLHDGKPAQAKRIHFWGTQ
jgi:hypothetical protein